MQVEVTVMGMAGTGKSTVARLIEVALADLVGIKVERIDNNGTTELPDEPDGVIESTMRKRIASLIAGGLTVTVKTMMTPRSYRVKSERRSIFG